MPRDNSEMNSSKPDHADRLGDQNRPLILMNRESDRKWTQTEFETMTRTLTWSFVDHNRFESTLNSIAQQLL